MSARRRIGVAREYEARVPVDRDLDASHVAVLVRLLS